MGWKIRGKNIVHDIFGPPKTKPPPKQPRPKPKGTNILHDIFGPPRPKKNRKK